MPWQGGELGRVLCDEGCGACYLSLLLSLLCTAETCSVRAAGESLWTHGEREGVFSKFKQL